MPSSEGFIQQADIQSSHLGNKGFRGAWVDEVNSQIHRLCRRGQLLPLIANCVTLPVMSRLIVTVCVISLFPLTVAAQVKVIVPQQNQKKYETIHASLENAGSKPVTFCIEVGQTSPRRSGEIEATPSPFWVQRNNNGKWCTLVIGPYVGSLKSPEVLDPGKTMKFPFRLGDSGQMRLRLNYWNGSLPSLDCHAPPNGARRVTSAVFTVE